MARIIEVEVTNYRSVEGPVVLRFPERCPIVLIGENNVGKSNYLRALNLVLGGFWPGNHDPEDNEFYNRERERNIQIVVRFDEDDPLGRYADVTWGYDAQAREPYYLGFRDHHGNGRGYVKTEDREQCTCVLLEAERELRYQLSYTSKYTLLSKLMHKFHHALMEEANVKQDLEGLFESVKQKFQEIPEFRTFVDQLRLQLGDFIGSMTHRLQVDFEAYNPVNFFHALRLHADENGTPRAIDEMGTGEQQILALSFAYAYARAFHGGIVLALEEPEAHLHPLAQAWLAKKLFEMCEGGLQIIITTHSPHFIDLLHLEGLVLLRKIGGATTAVQLTRQALVEHCLNLGSDPNRTTVDRILPFYHDNATPSVLEGLFARAVVLVEGATEQLALPVLLGRLGFDTDAHGIAVIDVGGKGNLAKWRRLFTAYGIPTYVIFDNDASEDGEGNRREDALRSVGVPDGDHAAILQAQEWVVEDTYAVFGVDFETTFRGMIPGYEDLEAEARENGIVGKPLIARWVAERISIPAAGAAGRDKLEQLLNCVRSLAPADDRPQPDGAQ